MSWSAKLFFFGLLAFAIYVFAVGDQTKWLNVLKGQPAS